MDFRVTPHFHGSPQRFVSSGTTSQAWRKAKGLLPCLSFWLVYLALQTLLWLPSLGTRSRALGIPPSTAGACRWGFPWVMLWEGLCCCACTPCCRSTESTVRDGDGPGGAGSEQQWLLESGAPANVYGKRGSTESRVHPTDCILPGDQQPAWHQSECSSPSAVAGPTTPSGAERGGCSLPPWQMEQQSHQFPYFLFFC